MSHTSIIKLKVMNLQSLNNAGLLRGMELREQDTYRHYQLSRKGECQYVLAIQDNPEAYEIGLLPQADGSFQMIWDPWDRSIERAAGKDALGLICEYEAQEYARAHEMNGVSEMYREMQPDGTIRMRALYA